MGVCGSNNDVSKKSNSQKASDQNTNDKSKVAENQTKKEEIKQNIPNENAKIEENNNKIDKIEEVKEVEIKQEQIEMSQPLEVINPEKILPLKSSAFKKINSFSPEHEKILFSCFTPKYFVSGNCLGQIISYDVESWEKSKVIEVCESPITSICDLCMNGEVFLTAHKNGSLYQTTIKKETFSEIHKIDNGFISKIVYAIDGINLYISSFKSIYNLDLSSKEKKVKSVIEFSEEILTFFI